MPKTALKGTAMAATSSVSFTAAQASGSARALKNSAGPLRKPSTMTTMSGRNKNPRRKTTARPMRAIRAFRPSLATSRVWTRSEISMSDMTKPPAAPGLEQVDQQQQLKRDYQHQESDDRGSLVVELLELDDDE